MGDERSQRLDDALSSLVDILVPKLHNEDEATADERHDDALDLARSIIEGAVSDVNHAADLIKKKRERLEGQAPPAIVLRDNDSPDKAVQFSNLYARLLTQPVLSQKWSILYLLHQLADSTPFGDNLSLNGEPQPDSGGARLRERKQSQDDQVFQDAFASPGLSRLPTHESQRRAPFASAVPEERKSRNRDRKRFEGTHRAEGGSEKEIGKEFSEAALLRDLPFTLQGISSNNLPFSSLTTLDLPAQLPLPIISLLNTLAEPSLLYRNLSDFVERRDEGLIGQSLRSAISNELRSYLGLIATLEGEIRRAFTTSDNNDQQGRIGKAGVTLKRCVIWTREATMGLRLMSLMTEEAKKRKGGQLISMIHSFSTSHGDPFVGAFAERMLSHVTRPFYDMLRQWIYDGELSDPYHEFFVHEQDSQDHSEDPRRAPATSVWEEKYRLEETMIPSIVTEEFARKIFLIGKSLNFIRYSCGDSAWVEAYCKEASKELRYGDTATLETSIDNAYKATMARLIYLMDDKFRLFEHLNALKRYLLLGQGDFIALLMESLSTNLDRPAGSQYRHTLTAQLEHGIRGSNAQFDSPDILRRLDARLTEMEKGDTGWDVFTLEYKVDAPVDVIINPWANRQYLKIFNLLWRVKRVEFALGSTWRRCITGARGVLAAVDAKTNKDWKSARCCIAEMIHFINQLQYYILFEVIEASWDRLLAAIHKPDCTLDDLIEAHTKYLKAITHKGLLGSSRQNNTTGHREDVFTVQLHELLKTMLAYKDAVDGLYSFSVAEFTRRQELSAKIETRTAQGGKSGTLTEKDDEDLNSPSPFTAKPPALGEDLDSPFPIPLLSRNTDDNMLPALRKRLNELSTDFKTRVNNLLGDLAVQPDADMKFLAVVMNFNDVYAPRKRRREHHKGGGGEKKTPAAQTETAKGGKTAPTVPPATAQEEKGKGKEEQGGAAAKGAAKGSRGNVK
ncbi:Microtubule-nucleating Tub4p (gamma-tubulin) complex component [Lecanora helva]